MLSIYQIAPGLAAAKSGAKVLFLLLTHETDLARWFVGRKHQLPDRIEHDLELGVILLLQRLKFSGQLGA